MTHPELIVDQALKDPFAVPSGLDGWLRRIERNARDLHIRLDEAIRTDGLVLPVIGESYGELDRLLFDSVQSALYRLLRRPLGQLDLNTPAIRSFGRRMGSLFERASQALALQHEADVLFRELKEMRIRFEPQFPRAVAIHIRAARLDPDSFMRLRRSTDVRVAQTRLARVQSFLLRLEGAAPEPDGVDAPVEKDSDAPTLRELKAMACLHLRRRGAVMKGPLTLHPMRATAVAQINALAPLADRSYTGGKPVHLTAQVLAEKSLSQEAGSARDVHDTLLWTPLIAAAEAARFPTAEGCWTPKVALPAREALSGISVTTYFANPLDDRYVLITRDRPSGVVVASRRIAVQETIECSLYGHPDENYHTALAAADLSPLFDGVVSGRACMYTVRRKAELRVLARAGDSWYARLERRGIVRPDELSLSVEHLAPEKLLVLHSLSPASIRQREVEVEPINDRVRGFAGVSTYQVRTALAGAGVAWFRTSRQRKPSGSDLLQAESELWTRLRARDPSIVPRSAGRGRWTERKLSGHIYLPPLALEPADCRPLEHWITEELHAFIRAVARIFLAVNGAGYCLGFYHPKVFGYAIEHDVRLSPVPRAVILHGAASARHGASLRPIKPVDDLTYPNLRFRGMTPPCINGEPAGPETDALSLALMLLELLASEPLGPERVWHSWEDLPAVVAASMDRFADPELAEQLASGIGGQTPEQSLLDLIQNLAKPADAHQR